MGVIKNQLNHWIHRDGMALNTDFYELTMLAGFWAHHQEKSPACFEYFFRDLPPDTGFAVFAGLEQLLDYIENIHFTDDDLKYLQSLSIFPAKFIQWLRDFRFTGDIWSISEGSLIFPNEPVVRVEGQLGEVQLIETFLLNALNYPTLIATKAAKICLAANNDPVIEFGLRRAQGPDGGLIGSRAAYIGGCIGTSNCLAGKTFGIPVKGTHAHSWVMAFASELDAFNRFIETYPYNAILLVDTYDVLTSGIPNAISAFRSYQTRYPSIRASIRIDSGDLAKLSKASFEMLADAGFHDPLIVASNDLDESLIADIRRQGAKINAWGVGTKLITGSDYPALGGVYKLVAIQEGNRWSPKIKRSSNIEKLTNPGRKSLLRFFDEAGHPVGDLVCDVNEPLPDIQNIIAFDQRVLLKRIVFKNVYNSESLLNKVVSSGRRCLPRESLENIRLRARSQIDSLTPELSRMRNPDRYPVGLSLETAHLKRSLIENGP